ncbi:MAG: helix-turn-helix transcriptional regulator [Clostridia bacterium]|nr:helix-turn-helix transcriptional regulator [Clostridia bacterium]
MKVFWDYGPDLVVELGYPVITPDQDVTLFHLHPQYEVFWFFEPAKCSTIINGRYIETDYPMAIITSPYCMHFTYFLSSSYTKINRNVLYFDDQYIRDMGADAVPIKDILGNSQAVILNLNQCEPLFHRVSRDLVDMTGRFSGARVATTNQRMLSAVVVSLLHEYSRRPDVGFRISQKHYISEVMLYMVRNLEQNLVIPEIADRFFVSRDKLCRDFRTHVQMSIGDFIGLARLNLAKNYLLDNDMTIKQIAPKCGFDNDIYFYSFFKRHTGMTPKEYVKLAEERKAKMHKLYG